MRILTHPCILFRAQAAAARFIFHSLSEAGADFDKALAQLCYVFCVLVARVVRLVCFGCRLIRCVALLPSCLVAFIDLVSRSGAAGFERSLSVFCLVLCVVWVFRFIFHSLSEAGADFDKVSSCSACPMVCAWRFPGCFCRRVLVACGCCRRIKASRFIRCS